MAHHIIGPADVTQLDLVLSRVADLADAIKHVAQLQIEDGADFDEHKAVIIRELSSQAGWLAEQAAKNIGSPGYVGDAQAWMLPPGWHKAEREKGRQHG